MKKKIINFIALLFWTGAFIALVIWATRERFPHQEAPVYKMFPSDKEMEEIELGTNQKKQ